LGAKANLAGGNAFTGAQTVTGTVIGSQVLRVLGASGQTANLQQWENGGVVQASVTPFGGATFATGGTVYGRLSVNAGTATTVGAVIRGAASQSANLQEWQNSAGSIVARTAANGEQLSTVGFRGATLNTSNYNFSVNEVSGGATVRLQRLTAASASPGSNYANLYFRDGTNAGTLKLVVRAGAAGAETTILDNIPQ
jgi:hypothetical protein